MKQERTITVEFYRSEMMHSRCISISEECWQYFLGMFNAVGFKIEEKELREPFGAITDYHKARETIKNVYSIQGLKHDEGENCLPAIDRLVSEYAKLK